ncbi:MAG: hypothetical protein ACI3XQ_09075, partial [Eubacteriales bacterium]
MKKLLSLFLTALFCFSASLAMITGISAESPDDHLVLHYDFEGETLEEKLRDKAPGGVSDDLKLSYGEKDEDGNYLGITFSNGYVTQKQSDDQVRGKRAFLQQKTAASDDMKKALEGNMTFVARFRMNEEVIDSSVDSDGYAYIFDARVFGESRAFKVILNLNNANYDLQIGFAGSTSPNSETTLGISMKDYDFKTSPWINLVCTISKNSNNSWDLKAYYTFGDPDGSTNWVNKNQSNKYEGEDRAPLTTNAAKVFTNSCRTGLCVDDIKLYDTVLTADEINSVTKIAPAQYVGFQKSAVTDGKYNVRFVSSVNALDFKGVGMEVNAVCEAESYNKTFESTETKTVYNKLLGRTSDGTEILAVSASDFDAEYLFCLTVLGVPEGKEVSFDIVPYV